MTSDTSEFKAILRRIETLETANRRLRRAGAAVLLIAIGLVAMGQVKPSRTVEAQESAPRRTQQSKRVPPLTAEEIANEFD